jgi:hypothetical protein
MKAFASGGMKEESRRLMVDSEGVRERGVDPPLPGSGATGC